MDVSVDALMTWWTVREASRTLDYTYKAVYTLMRKGKLRGVRTRFGWLVEPASVIAYRDARDAARQRIVA